MQVAPSIAETRDGSIRPEKTILVQIADPAWTLRALEQACPMALTLNAEIVLLALVPVQHLGWLGIDLGWSSVPAECRAQYTKYVDSVRLYGIPVSIQPFQYATVSEALVQASENLNANVVFATLPVRFGGLFHQVRLRWLDRQLMKQGCQFVSTF